MRKVYYTETMGVLDLDPTTRLYKLGLKWDDKIYDVELFYTIFTDEWYANIKYCGATYRIYGCTGLEKAYSKIRNTIKWYAKGNGYLRFRRRYK